MRSCWYKSIFNLKRETELVFFYVIGVFWMQRNGDHVVYIIWVLYIIYRVRDWDHDAIYDIGVFYV